MLKYLYSLSRISCATLPFSSPPLQPHHNLKLKHWCHWSWTTDTATRNKTRNKKHLPLFRGLSMKPSDELRSFGSMFTCPSNKSTRMETLKRCKAMLFTGGGPDNATSGRTSKADPFPDSKPQQKQLPKCTLLLYLILPL